MTRFLARRFALTALAVWLATTVVPVFAPHNLLPDFACGDEAWGSPHPTSQFESVRPPVGDGHCVICHLQRTMRGAMAEAVGALVVSPAVAVAPAAAPQHLARHRAEDLPARAPPIRSL